jgi:hypothetical protein
LPLLQPPGDAEQFAFPLFLPVALRAAGLWLRLLLRLHPAAVVASRSSCYTPLNPYQLAWRSRPHQHLLDPWSPQMLMTNFLRRRGCEPPRSATRRLEFVINHCWGPGGRAVAGLTCRPRCLQNPSHGHLPFALLAWVWLMAIVMGVLGLARAFAEDCLWHHQSVGRVRRCGGRRRSRRRVKRGPVKPGGHALCGIPATSSVSENERIAPISRKPSRRRHSRRSFF